MTLTGAAGYRTMGVPVRGGELAAGVWERGSGEPGAGGPGAAGVPTVLALHGITASHLSWPAVVRAVPGIRFVAPDLRGRGRSNALPGPFGMPAHAEDAVALLDRLGIERAIVLGHSMGGFAAVTFADRYPDRTSGIVLVDGGLPLPLPAGMTAEEATAATIGPASARLSMTFPTHEAYHDFWRAHPAFSGRWNADVEAYVDYDLVGEEPELHASGSIDAIAEDSAQLQGDAGYLDALEALEAPVHFLRAERGMLDQPGGLYPPDAVAQWAARVPALVVHEVPGVNHYTIVMSDVGAAAIAGVVRTLIPSR